MGGEKQLLKDTAFRLVQAHRYGIVGSNGVGKSTFMERIVDGSITELCKSNLRFAHNQHVTLNEPVDPSTMPYDFARADVGGDAWLHNALERVGFTAELVRRPLGELSGGRRVAGKSNGTKRRFPSIYCAFDGRHRCTATKRSNTWYVCAVQVESQRFNPSFESYLLPRLVNLASEWRYQSLGKSRV